MYAPSPPTPHLLKDLCTLRGPYSFFLRVVRVIRKPDGILAWLQVGLPRQKCRIIEKNGEKIVRNLNISLTIAFYFCYSY